MYQYRLFFVFVLITTFFLPRPSIAVPTVKKFGSVPSNTLLDKNTHSNSPAFNQRTPSLRLSGTTGKSAIKTTDNIKNTSKTKTQIDSARLPGLHGNVIKSINSKNLVNKDIQSNSYISAETTQHIIDLEAQMLNKQEILEPGNGINIEGKVISLSDDITSLPEKMDILNQMIENLNEKVDTGNLSKNYYTISEVQNYINQNYYSKQYVDQIVSQLSNTNVVKDFDPRFLHHVQNQSEQP